MRTIPSICVGLPLLVCPAAASAGGLARSQAAIAIAMTHLSDEPLTQAELEELLGPIALYPDDLLANVLAASVYPDEVAGISRAVASGATPQQIDARNWSDPVKAVAKVPDALKIMADYPEWTTALGQAYLAQPKDVMDAVQSLRKKAKQNGALESGQEQQVIVQPDTIIIQSASPDYVYVPWYDPGIVYVDDPGDEILAGAVGFGVGIIVGAALHDLDCDWHGGCVAWGWNGHNDIDIDINGDVNIGNRVNVGNRVGNEGNAWKPDRTRNLASSKSDQVGSFRSGNTTGRRPATPKTSAPAAAARPGEAGARAPRTPAKLPSRDTGPRPTTPTPSRIPAARPPMQIPPSATGASRGAFEGGRQTQVESARGSRSGQSAASRGGARPARGGRRGR